MTDVGFRKTKRSLPIALLRAREQVMEPIRAMLADSGVTEQKWRVLRVLEEAGEIEPTVIAREACLHLPSLSRILKTMEQDGLVQRREDEQDRRKTVIAISEAGRAILSEHAAQSAAILVDIERRLGAEKIEAMLDLLEELTDDPGPLRARKTYPSYKGSLGRQRSWIHPVERRQRLGLHLCIAQALQRIGIRAAVEGNEDRHPGAGHQVDELVEPSRRGVVQDAQHARVPERAVEPEADLGQQPHAHPVDRVLLLVGQGGGEGDASGLQHAQRYGHHGGIKPP